MVSFKFVFCSKFVAEAFGKEHRNIVGNIENPLKDLADVSEKDMLKIEHIFYKFEILNFINTQVFIKIELKDGIQVVDS